MRRLGNPRSKVIWKSPIRLRQAQRLRQALVVIQAPRVSTNQVLINRRCPKKRPHQLRNPNTSYRHHNKQIRIKLPNCRSPQTNCHNNLFRFCSNNCYNTNYNGNRIRNSCCCNNNCYKPQLFHRNNYFNNNANNKNRH